MTLIIGLGNPGKKYKKTRHNIGFRILDEFARKNNFPEFRLSKKFRALISEKDNVILAKPQTFMNDSGKSVKSLTENSSLPSWQRTVLCIVHDDIDLPLGEVRIVKNRGAAGHKGVESIIKELSSKDFGRLRVGIQPGPGRGKPQKVEKFVLQKFDKEEEKIIEKTIQKAIKELRSLAPWIKKAELSWLGSRIKSPR